MKFWSLFVVLILIAQMVVSQYNIYDPFKQLDEEHPTPNVYRNASGAPGVNYWQQKVDYNIKVKLNDKEMRLYGEAVVTYTNKSPDKLNYLWFQMDQNIFDINSIDRLTENVSLKEGTYEQIAENLTYDMDGGFKLLEVEDVSGVSLKYIVNGTMMRVDLPQLLLPNKEFKLKIKYWYNINNNAKMQARTGYETFSDSNRVYCIAQFYPRLCQYNDIVGWQNKQFLGRGEFTLSFGDYHVEIQVPRDHIVAATGELVNKKDVLDDKMRNRLLKATQEYNQPVMIRTLDEAVANSKTTEYEKYKTWVFDAENVRDFAFASSRRFLWDAMAVKRQDQKPTIAQSMWLPEGDCLWSKFSTKAIAHTIKWYSHYTFEYPYPTAWSVDGNMGMEYPMIAFNKGRCELDNTYSFTQKYSHIGVIIHEIGHNWFPMIVNSDERQWTWLDEGLNTFLQFLTEQQWERNYPSKRGHADNLSVLNYMTSQEGMSVPIMTNSESILQFGNNAYGKPATALNILRETVLGRELFDFAFKQYANRWKFKTPYPADFFRTIEDASATDLDWFWRGWFYTTDFVDQSIEDVQMVEILSQSPNEEYNYYQENNTKNISKIRYNAQTQKTLAEIDTTISDVYTKNLDNKPDILDSILFVKLNKSNLINNKKGFLYTLRISNVGKLVMPIIIELNYEDGTSETKRFPVEIWRYNWHNINKTILTDKKVRSFVLDPYKEIADTNIENNSFPKISQKSKMRSYLDRRTQENGIQREKKIEQLKN